MQRWDGVILGNIQPYRQRQVAPVSNRRRAVLIHHGYREHWVTVVKSVSEHLEKRYIDLMHYYYGAIG